MRRVRLLRPEIALSIASLVLAIAALEVGVRLRLSATDRARLPHVGLDDQDQNRLRWAERHRESDVATDDGLGFDRPDPLLGWSPIPNAARRVSQPGAFDVEAHTTVDGIRGRAAVERPRTPGRTRIAVFGCSQTFGGEVEDDQTYSARLASELAGVEVLNFGVHGYGTDQMLLRYERDGAPYRPDVVVVGFAYYHVQRNGDDFRFYAKPRFVLDGGALRLIDVPVPSPAEYVATVAAPAPWALLDRSVLLRWAWQTVLRGRENRLYEPSSPAWNLTRALLARFADETRANGARFVLVNVEDDRPELFPVLDALARADGVTFVNAGAVLGDLRRGGRRLRIPDNAHWGPEGHAIIAHTIATALCRDGLVPPASCAGL